MCVLGLVRHSRESAWIFLFIPSVAVIVRRFHDQDKSGLWTVLMFIPAISLIGLFFMFRDGTKGPNRYGLDPKGRVADIFS